MAEVEVGLGAAKEAVEKLYHFRDHYFEEHSIDRAIHKIEDLQKELDKAINVIDSIEVLPDDRAALMMLKGIALNVMPKHDKAAEECLAKAVKLKPQLVDAWVNLGECSWKKNDVSAAHDCFLGALNHAKDKKALRNLSMVLRQLGKDQAERMKNIEDSVEKAKEAVQLDIADGTSWFILGNAYLSLFFAANQSPKILKQCTGAYQQAERDSIAANNPDMHFNRATVYKYQEEYELGLKGFARASALDPLWSEPKEREQQLLKYLTQVQELVDAKGKIRGKKLSSLVSSLKDTDLGAYSGGSYTSPHGKTITLHPALFEDLSSEANTEKVVVGKVVCSINHEDPVPFTCCLVDKALTCFACTIYNIATGWGVKIGDSVAIPEPFVQNVDFLYGSKQFKLKSIRVDSPVVLVINGKKLGLDKQAPSMLAVSAMSE